MRLDDTVLRERSAQENFPVASRALPRPVRSHLLAIYGVARVVDDTGDELAGDRMGALDCARRPARPCVPGYRHAPRLRPPHPDAPRAGPRRRTVPRADRGEPRRPGGDPLRHLGVVARLLRALGEPGRASRAGRARCRHARSGRAGPTTSAPGCSSSSTCRTWARTTPAAACTSPPRISTGSARRRRTWRPPRHRARSARPSPTRSTAPVGLLHRAAPPLCRQPPGSGAGGGRRVRRAVVSQPSTPSSGPATTCSRVDARPSHVRTLYRTAQVGVAGRVAA